MRGYYKNNTTDYLLILSSNNKKSLNNFIVLFKKINFLNLKTYSVKSKKYKQLLSILKSPHVNKTAQEQFHAFKHIKLFKVTDINFNLLLYVLKSLRESGFSDLNFKLKSVKKQDKKSIKLTNPDYLNQILITNVVNYISFLDIYGETVNHGSKHF